MTRFTVLFVGSFLLSMSGAAQEEATFEGIGDLPGGSFSSTVYGLSGDGAVVVGSATPAEGIVAFRWEAGTMDSLGFLPGAPFNSSMAFGASEDGSVIVGQSNSEDGFRAFRYEDGEMESLGVLPGDSGSGAYGVSDDGSVAAGFSNGSGGLEAVRWEAGEGEGLGHLEGGVNSNARAMSADGSVVVGQSDREGFNVEEAFRWEDGTMEGLGYLAETAFTSWAYDVTADGSVVVGMSQSDYGGGGEGGDEAFLWEAEVDSMMGLGDLPGGFLSSWAMGVSDDGFVVVGQSSTEDEEGDPITEAFIWTQEEGMRSLKNVLEDDYGLDLTGWMLQEAVAVSNDGTVIVGNGTNPEGNAEGWRVALPLFPGSGTRYVDAATGSDSGNCTDPESPCATIGFAVGQAVADDTIAVAEGVYTESIAIDKNLVLHGESMAGTIIQAHGEPGQATDRVITIEESVEAEIAGVTVRHGVAPGSFPTANGGGLLVSDAIVTITNVTFSENAAPDGNGGGVHTINGSLTLANVVFVENTAGSSGAGMSNASESASTLTNVVFAGNGASAAGGGFFTFNATADFTNVTFSGNASGTAGGGVYHSCFDACDVTPTLTNTILWGNSAAESGNEIWLGPTASIALLYSLYGNGPGDIEGDGDFEIENSLTDDPLFVDPENGDFQLHDDSPAIDAGDPDTDFALFPVNDEGDPIDLDGNPRLFGDVIDIGAYEHQGTIANETSPEEVAETLSAPRPNPVRGSASFSLRVPESQAIVVEVFDVTGRRVQTLYDGPLAVGTREILTFDASVLPAGVYVVRASGEDFTATRQVTVIR